MKKCVATPPTEPTRLIRVKDIAYRLGVSRAHVYSFVKSGLLPEGKHLTKGVVVWPSSVIDEIIAKIEKEMRQEAEKEGNND